MTAVKDFTRQTVSANVAAKGQRLFAEGLVAHGPKAGEYRVKGDHGFYRVKVYSVSRFGVIGDCDCPARRACSHLFAAVLFAADRDGADLDASPSDPFDLR